MGLADDYLNVRPLITPEELISPKIDEQVNIYKLQVKSQNNTFHIYFH